MNRVALITSTASVEFTCVINPNVSSVVLSYTGHVPYNNVGNLEQYSGISRVLRRYVDTYLRVAQEVPVYCSGLSK